MQSTRVVRSWLVPRLVSARHALGGRGEAMLKARRNAWCSAIFMAACSVACLSGCASEPGPRSSEGGGQRLQGELKRVVTDPERGSSSIDYFLALSDETWLPLELDEDPDFEPNQPVLVRGEWTGPVFHVEAMELTTLT